jgi:hypothetical protein
MGRSPPHKSCRTECEGGSIKQIRDLGVSKEKRGFICAYGYSFLEQTVDK